MTLSEPHNLTDLPDCPDPASCGEVVAHSAHWWGTGSTSFCYGADPLSRPATTTEERSDD